MNIDQFILQNEIPIRLGFFFGVFSLMALWEFLAPCRVLSVSKLVRWGNNIALVFLNSVVLRLLLPTAAIGIAVFADQQDLGLLNYYAVPHGLAILASVAILDCVIYLQHVMLHAVPLLWRLHRVHHADLDFDVTTGVRFHTLEIILSMFIKFAVILLLGPPIVAVVIFEVVLNATSMFNHSNVSLPRSIDRCLRWIVVTPDMHRVHHSIHADEANSNFGFNSPWWDRLFGTYLDQPRDGHAGMKIGIHDYRESKIVSWLPGMLALPFRGRIAGYAINRRHQDDRSDD